VRDPGFYPVSGICAALSLEAERFEPDGAFGQCSNLLDVMKDFGQQCSILVGAKTTAYTPPGGVKEIVANFHIDSAVLRNPNRLIKYGQCGNSILEYDLTPTLISSLSFNFLLNKMTFLLSFLTNDLYG
jgi:hypothetical protein